MSNIDDRRIADLKKRMADRKTEENGTRLENQRGWWAFNGQSLVELKYHLRPTYEKIEEKMSLNGYNLSDSDSFVFDQYHDVCEYLDTPQGKIKYDIYMRMLEIEREDYKGDPKFDGKKARIVKSFESSRTHCPRIGTVGTVVDQNLLVDIAYDHFDKYPLVWVQFEYPFLCDHEIFLSADEFEKLTPETTKALFVDGVNEVWSGRDNETGMRFGFRLDEIELVQE